MDLSADQQNALDRISDWFQAAPKSTYCDDEDCEPYPHTHGNAHGYPVMSMGGLAGSGKTWLTGQLSEILDARIAYGAPTHRAASVLRGKLNEDDAPNVRTYHSLLYRPFAKYLCQITGEQVFAEPCECEDPDECDCNKKFTPCKENAGHDCQIQEDLQFVLRSALGGKRDLVILDEASMVSEQRVQEIASLGVPILLVGDHGQLPPVKENMNRWMQSPEIQLTTNHRQSDVTGIISAARMVRETGRLPHGSYGDGSTACMSAKADPSVLSIASRHRLPPSPDHAIITHTNQMRAAINRQYRDTDAHLASPGMPVVGDRVVSLQNGDRMVVTEKSGITTGEDGWGGDGELEFVFNGATGTVVSVRPKKNPKQQHVQCVVKLDADRRGREGTHILTDMVTKQLGAEKKLAPNEYPNGRHLWDLAYAITAHKCVDELTQILTTTGWKDKDQLSVGDLVLTLDTDTQMSSWQPVKAIHQYNVVNERLLSIEAESHSSLTTLNHRWPIRGFKNRTVWRTSHHLMENPQGYHAIFKSAYHQDFADTPKYSDAFVELVAWFWTEGGIHTNRGRKLDSIKIHQSETKNPECVASIRSALTTEFGTPRKLGRYTSTDPGWNESTRTLTQSARVGSHEYPEKTFDYVVFSLNAAAGKQIQMCAPQKIVSPEFLLSLTKSQLELFINTSIDGDGYTSSDGHRTIRQGSKDRLEAFQFACTLAGYSTVIRPSGSTWVFRLKKNQILNPRPQSWENAMSLIQYTGVVWCPQTENGTWLAKRNETTYFTGNSQGSEFSKVLVFDTNPPEYRRWLYTAMTRAKSKLVVVDWK